MAERNEPTSLAPVGRSVERLSGPIHFVVYCDGDCIPVNLGGHAALPEAREVARQHVQAVGCEVAIWREMSSLWEVWSPQARASLVGGEPP